jgi:hypothetical protein
MNAVCTIVVAVVGLAVIAASILTKLSAARRRASNLDHR